MDYRTRERLNRLDKLSIKTGATVYFVDQLEEGYSIHNATSEKDLGLKSKADFEAWCASIAENQPESVIVIDDIPEQ